MEINEKPAMRRLTACSAAVAGMLLVPAVVAATGQPAHADDSPSGSVPVTAGADDATGLERLAAELEPGRWRDVTAGMRGFDRELWKEPEGGRSILNFGARASWDPASKQLFFLSTGGPKDAKRFLTFSAVTNRWTVLPDPPWFKTDESPASHRLNSSAVDPDRSLFYYQSGSGTIYRYDIRKRAWSRLSPVEDAGTDTATALVYFPELPGLLGVFGPNVYSWSEPEQAWTRVGTCPTRATVHFAEYNPVQKLVLLGRVRGSPLYRLDRHGTITPLNDAPVRMSFGTAHVRVDPAGGLFVVPCRRAEDQSVLLTFDIRKDRWQEHPRIPVPEELFTRAMSVTIPEYGVLLFVTQTKAYLYKHSRSDS